MLKIRNMLLVICLFSCTAIANQDGADKIKTIQNNLSQAILNQAQATKTVKSKTPGLKNSAKTISFVDNDQISIVLSRVDINRISIKQDKILSLNGPTGLYTAKNDPSGAAYITVYSDTPFTLYITTINNHSLSLFVIPQATVGKTIVFVPTSVTKIQDTGEEDPSYQKLLVNLTSAMINKSVLDDYAYREVKNGKKTDFLGVADLKVITIYNGATQNGIIYEVRNKTSKLLTLNPAYFYQHGVKAVALSSQTIEPNCIGLLYEVVSKE